MSNSADTSFKQSTLVALSAVAAVVMGLIMYQWLSSSSAHAAASEAAPFEINDIDGNTRHSNEWKGQLRMINFWATWCAPCVREIPRLAALQNRYKADSFQVIGVALGESKDVKPFSIEHGINYPSLVGQTNVILAGINYGNPAGALPYTVFVNEEDKIVFKHFGELTDNHILHIEQQLLRNAVKVDTQ